MTEKEGVKKKDGRITRRDFLKYASASVGVAAGTLAITNSIPIAIPQMKPPTTPEYLHNGHPLGVAAASQTVGGRTPMEFLTDFYTVPKDPVTSERVFNFETSPQLITVARDVQFPAWTFSAPQRGPMVPGPTLRCSEGDKVLLKFHNGDQHPHTVHFHGIHPSDADGVFEVRNPGQTYDYKLTAEPFGLFPYHCHVMPVKKHISKGLYGALIIDPVDSATGLVTRPLAEREMVMVMNGFDMDFDDENEFYSVNGIANYYFENPIQIGVGELIRIYLVNMTEFDPVNSFHLHGNMFRLYRSGTRFDPTATFDRNISRPLNDRVKEWLYRDAFAEVADVVFLGQGERAILEFIPKHTGKFLFHAHQSEFVELGWTGLFNVI
jgi:FtsP/CotA-like multicopper oxidase with cupredoxin domain